MGSLYHIQLKSPQALCERRDNSLCNHFCEAFTSIPSLQLVTTIEIFLQIML